jgi:hypothetical protein
VTIATQGNVVRVGSSGSADFGPSRSRSMRQLPLIGTKSEVQVQSSVETSIKAGDCLRNNNSKVGCEKGNAAASGLHAAGCRDG